MRCLAFAAVAATGVSQAKECQISLHLSVLHADGTTDELCDVDPWGMADVLADLFPGDSISIAWEPVDCGGGVSLLVHQGQGSEPANAADPVVARQDVLLNPFAPVPMTPLRFALSGTFFIEATGTPVDFTARVFIAVTQQLSTLVVAQQRSEIPVRYADGALQVYGPANGQLRVLNAAGQQVMAYRISAAIAPSRIAFEGPSGVYIASIPTASGYRQSRFVIP